MRGQFQYRTDWRVWLVPIIYTLVPIIQEIKLAYASGANCTPATTLGRRMSVWALQSGSWQ